MEQNYNEWWKLTCDFHFVLVEQSASEGQSSVDDGGEAAATADGIFVHQRCVKVVRWGQHPIRWWLSHPREWTVRSLQLKKFFF